MNFYIPPTLSQDFEEMLNIPGFGTQVTINPNLSATPIQTIVQLSNPKFKTNYQNITDNSLILRFKLLDDIRKGDYLVTKDKVTYLITWQPFKDINSYKSQCQLCNTSLDFEVWEDSVLDNDTGEVTTSAGYSSVAENIKCFTVKNSMGVFGSGVGEIGIVPQGRLLIGTQFNNETVKIKVGNEFSYHGVQYKITNLDYSQLEDDQENGCLVLYTEQLEGGRKVASV